MPTEFEKYWPVLRALNFKKQWESKHQDGAARQYIREEKTNNRTIEVRINQEPPHHVTHCVHHPDHWGRAKWTTLPIEFNDEFQLAKFIINESKRIHNFDDPSEVK